MSKKFSSNLLYSLVCAVSSFSIAFGSLFDLGWTDRVSLQRGLFLMSCGFVHFISLTTFFNKVLLETKKGLEFISKFHISLSDCLDISNKLVSAFQAILSFVFGSIICGYSCSKNFLWSSVVITESYAWFASAYFLYDIFSMYRVWNAKIFDRLKLKKIDFDNRLNDFYSKVVPSLKNGELRIFQKMQIGDEKIPNFMEYLRRNPLIVFHHLLIGGWGLLVIAHLRGSLGDCIFSFFYVMEFSTPFVSFRAILSILKLKSSFLYMVNGVCMILSFFVVRILTLPYLLIKYSSVINQSVLSAAFSLPLTCRLSILAVFLPQFYWFYLISKGAIKMFFPPKTKTS